MKNIQNIFDFYKWVNSINQIKYITFTLCDDDGGSTYTCLSKKELINILHNDINMDRLYRKEYTVNILELHYKQ